MSGRIMPEPFAIPVTVAMRPGSCVRRDRAFGTESVVMIASAARAQLSSRRSAMHAGRPATMRSTGSGAMITPVENGRTWRESQPASRATASQLALAPVIPVFPVPALALPVLTSSARGDSPETRCSLATCTGAAQKGFCVNTPETRVPSASVMRSRSLRPAFRIPASATPRLTPLTGNRSSGRGGLKLTAIFFQPLLVAARPPDCPRSSQFAVTVLVFFSRSARTRIVAADLAHLSDERRRLRRRSGIGSRSCERFLIPGVLVLHVLERRRLQLLHLLDLLAQLQLDCHQRARHFQFDRFHEVAEEFERFALVFLLRVLLRVAAEMNPLAQVIERREQYEPLELMHGLRRIGRHLADVGGVGFVDRALEQRVVIQARVALEPLRQR